MTDTLITVSEENKKQTNPLLRVLFIMGGTLFLGLAVLGIFLPVLPTAPFLLLSAALYMRSSERLFNWMTENSLIKPHYERLKNKEGMTMRAKISILLLAWTMLILAAILIDSLFMKVFLIGLAVVKTIVFAKIKTAEQK